MEKQKKLKHFAWNFEVSKSGILKSEKNDRILRSSGFWNFLQIPLVSTLTGHEKCRPFCPLGALTDIRTARAQKNRDTLLDILGYLKVEYCKSEKRARTLRSSGF
jgi:hypothetical protein